MDIHGEFACELFKRDGVSAEHIVDALKVGEHAVLGPKMETLFFIAEVVRVEPRKLTRADVVRAIEAGSTDADVQLVIMIASAFSMYNRMVEGLRTQTPATSEAYRKRAVEVADQGYVAPRLTTS